MKPKAANISIRAWEADGILLEQYAYTSGTVEPLPKHTHETYQLGLSFDCSGEYYYGGEYHCIPTGSLSIIHWGEVHSPSDRTYLPEPVSFWMMHIHPAWLQTITAEINERFAVPPFFKTVFITDSMLNHLFLKLHSVISKPISQLEQDTDLWQFLSYLVVHHAQEHPCVSPHSSSHAGVKVARDYLHVHYADEIALDELAQIAGLSRFHFCRIFRKEVGVSPSTYQTQLRIAQAKKLLVQGMSIATVASLTGFYDQSHFGWHFKRQVGVTPKRYGSNTAIFS